MTAENVYSRNCIPNEKYLSSKILALLYFRQKIKYKIALCQFAHALFVKTLLDPRNK